jgi:hypothetical protein
VAASKKKKFSSRYISKPSNEPVLYKRERNKINSLARALQLEHALYQDETVMRFAAISNQINNVDKHVEDLRPNNTTRPRKEGFSCLSLFAVVVPLSGAGASSLSNICTRRDN